MFRIHLRSLDLRDLAARREKFILIGGGSNLLVSDEGLDVTVLRYASDTPQLEIDGDEIVVSSLPTPPDGMEVARVDVIVRLRPKQNA